MTVTVRQRTAADMTGCARLLVEVHRIDGYPVEGVADSLGWLSPATLRRAWVGDLHGTVVGHGLVHEATEADDAAVLWSERSGESPAQLLVLGRLFVGPAGRNQGVGARLVRAAMGFAQDQGCRMVLDVMEKDHTAIRLYERMGWQNIGAVTHYFGEGKEVPAQCYVAPSHSTPIT